MKIQWGKYITIEEVQIDNRKTSIFKLYSQASDCFIGEIKWHGAWRKYCLFPQGDTVWDVRCLTDINMFITNLMDARNNNDEK